MTATLEKEKMKLRVDPLVSFIVPAYDLPPMVFKRCLMSLADQDYKKMEVIVVLDGPNDELRKIAEMFCYEHDHFHLKEIEHAGACAARNEGFKISRGEIVSFFNSDYIAKPGMVRMWVDALLNNPDCGFVYGGYEYAASNAVSSNQRWIYGSKPFDAWELTVANYIDCGFPVWRKYVEPWDVNCKSLQDWDFWLSVIEKHKVKGFYLEKDYSFIAEPPRPKGLSMDSSSHWIDRVRYVKSKHHIQERDILVASTGAAGHAREIAKMIGADYRDDTFDKPHEYKALYNIGFYIFPNEVALNENARRLAIFKERYPKARRIVHFVGADIYWLRKFPWESLKYLAGALKQSADIILSENQEAHAELYEFGIPSEIVPIPSYTKNWEVKPLPKDFTVGIYLVEPGSGRGESNFDKYCYEQSLSIVRGMPDVKFTAYGYGGKDIRYPNLKHYGVIERDKWKDYVYDNSALMRICRHDHHPMASNEFIMAGRSVITNIPGQGVNLIDTSGKEDISRWDKFGEGLNVYHWPATKKKFIQEIRKVRKNPEVHQAAIADLRHRLDQETYIKKIKELCHV